MFISNNVGTYNKDLKPLDHYLELTKDFKSSFAPFCVVKEKGFNIIDESQACSVGYKARAGEFLLTHLRDIGIREIVYVQPRRGFAGISLAYLCQRHGLKLTLIMPSSKEISNHQALCIQYGAKAMFLRVAAMPNANMMAKKYADEDKSRYFIPLGLGHEYVIAGGVRAVYDFFRDHEKPSTMWTTISTGVLSRTLQIALPTTYFLAVGVARNIKNGELGRAEFISYDKPFESTARVIPETFDCENSYDAKCWEFMVKYGCRDDWFFSVAGNAPLSTINKSLIDSYRNWGDKTDFI